MGLYHHWPNFVMPWGVEIPKGFRLLHWKRDFCPHWKHKDHNIHLLIETPECTNADWVTEPYYHVCSEMDHRDEDAGGSTMHHSWEDALKEIRELVDYYEDGLKVPYQERVEDPKTWETY